MLLEQIYILLNLSALDETSAGGQMEVYSSPDQCQ